ncbi:MAG: response regulator transcription factor, partial [Microbacteriaceae bacterium]|nr:response regulator transcription factor [Microbacteriaceae bacterium]
REYLAALAGEPVGGERGELPSGGATVLAVRAVREALAGRVHRASELLARADLASSTVASDLAVAVAGVVVTRRSEDAPASIRPFVARIGALVAANGITSPLALLPDEDREAVLAEAERPDQAEALRAVFARYAAHAIGPGVTVELTGRERAVLEQLARTPSRTELAERLHVSVNTIKTQLRTMYRKLGVGDRDAALLRAVELGLLELGSDGPAAARAGETAGEVRAGSGATGGADR